MLNEQQPTGPAPDPATPGPAIEPITVFARVGMRATNDSGDWATVVSMTDEVCVFKMDDGEKTEDGEDFYVLPWNRVELRNVRPDPGTATTATVIAEQGIARRLAALIRDIEAMEEAADDDGKKELEKIYEQLADAHLAISLRAAAIELNTTA